jgi:hypothetical protein
MFAAPFCSLPILAEVIPVLQPVEDLLPPTFWERHGQTVLQACLLIGLLLILALSWRRRARSVPPPVPASVARETLWRLVGAPDNSHLAGLVLQTLRQYLGATLAARPRTERTADEIITQLQSEKAIRPELQGEIIGLLQQCQRRHFYAGHLALETGLATRALIVVEKLEAAKLSTPLSSAPHP